MSDVLSCPLCDWTAEREAADDLRREGAIQALRDAANTIPAVYNRGNSPSSWLDRAADRIESEN